MTPPEGHALSPHDLDNLTLSHLTLSHLTLRPALPGDVDALAVLHVAARRAGRMPPSLHSADHVAAALTEALTDDHVWVAELEGRPVGYVRFVAPDATRRAWLDDLYVAPDAERQGIGSTLLDLVRAMLPDGFGLWVFAENHPARRFYAARGLVELGETDGSQNPEGAPEVEMAWEPTTPGG